MPGFDGSGPRGQGPMSGKGRGYCVVPLKKPDYKRMKTRNDLPAYPDFRPQRGFFGRCFGGGLPLGGKGMY